MANEARLQNGALSSTQVGAYNVYTGARYVPLIAGQWDSTKNYEPLTVVTNMGNSYTSAQYVPAGVPLQNNGPYWFKTGDFNSQVASLDSRVTTNTENITNLQNDIETLTPKRNVIMIGNSYTKGIGSNQNGIYYQIKNKFGVSRVYASDGLAFVPYSNISDSYLTMLQHAINDTTYDKNIITDIIFISAIGDTRAYNSLGNSYYSALRTNLSAIQSLIVNNFNPSVRVSVAFAEMRNAQNIGNEKFYHMYPVHLGFEGNLQNYGMEYLGWISWNQQFASTLFENDNYHPNTLGMGVLGTNLMRALNGNYEIYPVRRFFQGTATIQEAKQATYNVACTITPNNFIFFSNGISSASPIVLQQGAPIFLFHFTDYIPNVLINGYSGNVIVGFQNNFYGALEVYFKDTYDMSMLSNGGPAMTNISKVNISPIVVPGYYL